MKFSFYKTEGDKPLELVSLLTDLNLFHLHLSLKSLLPVSHARGVLNVSEISWSLPLENQDFDLKLESTREQEQ